MQEKIELEFSEKRTLIWVLGLVFCVFLNHGYLFGQKKQIKERPHDSILLFGESFMYSPDSIQQYLQKIEHLPPLEKDSVLIRLGVNYNKKGNYDSALNFHFKGLNHAIEYGLENEKARQLLNIGLNYRFLKQFEKSEKYSYQALEIYEKLKDSSNIASFYNNITLHYTDQKKYKKALEFSQLSIELKRAMKLPETKFNYANLARIYFYINEYDSAIKYFEKGLSAVRQDKDYHSESYISGYLAEVYLATKQYQKALLLYENGIEIANRIESLDSKKSLLLGYSEVLHLLEKNEKAFLVMKQHNELSDSLANYRNNKELAKIENQYKLNLQDKETKLLRAQTNVEIYRRELLILLITVVVIILCYVVYRYFTKLKLIKEEQKRIHYLNEQKVKRLQQEKELKAFKSFLEGQEKERYRVARDLHDGVGGLLASLKFHVQGEVEQNSTYDFSRVIDGIDDAYQEIRFIASNLAPPNFQETSFADILSGYLSDLDSLKDINISLYLDPEEKINSLPDLIKVELYRVFQELIANIVKHAKASFIDVQLLCFDEYINLIVEDNGVGFDIETQGKGMGLNNIKSRIKALDGKLNIDSFVNRGSIFNIDIPVSF